MKWKNSKELKKELHNYVLQTADELVVELKERKDMWKIRSKQEELCIM